MKKSVFLKVVCALLAVLMTSIMFAACNGAKSGTNTQTNATAGGDDAPVPHYDWGGRPLDILGTHNAHEPNFELVGNSDGNIVEQAVFSRNSQIEDYYNVEINDIGTESDKPLTLIQNTIFTGDHLYDLAFLVRNDMSTAIQNGYFTDLTALPYLDFTKNYYNSLSIESMKVGGRLFHMVSDFSLVDKARTNVLFYNRDLGAEYHFDDIIQLVRDGDWTFEEMYKNMKNADLDGNDMRDLSDLWGLVCGGKEGAAAFWSALGNKMVTVNKDGEWSVDVANEHSVNSKLSDSCRDNFFRSANCGIGIDPIRSIDNIHIKGIGICVLEGADYPRATGDGGKILADPCPKKPEDLLKYANWISEEHRAQGKTDFDEEHSHSFGTDAGKDGESQWGDWRGIGILFAKATHFSIENLLIVHSHGWGISLEDCSFGSIDKIEFDSCMEQMIDGMRQNTENQDGIDLRNGCHDIVISNITGGTGDDLIALTAIADQKRPRPDGAVNRTTHVMSNDWTKRDPDIHDIIIRNVVGYSKGGICFLIRLLPANAKIWNVVIDGVIDTSPEGFDPGGVLLLGSGDGEYGKNPVDGMRFITVSNMVCNSHRAIIVGGYISDSSFSNIVNHNQATSVITVYRKDGFRNNTCSNLVSVNGRIIEERPK